MDNIFEFPYYRITRWLMRATGLCPYQNRGTNCIRRLFIVFSLITVLTVQIVGVLKVNYNVDAAVETISAFTTSVPAIVFYSASFNRESMFDSLKHIKETWDLIRDKEELNIIMRSTKEGSSYTLRTIQCLVVISIIAGTCTILSSIIPDHRSGSNSTNVHSQVIMIESIADSGISYYALLLLVQFCIPTVIIGMWATLSIIITIAYHACGMFRITGYRLEHAFDNNRALRERISEAVEYHQKSIKFVNIISSIYGWPMLISFLFGCINITISLYRVIIAQHWRVALTFLLFSIAQLMFMYLLVYPGQKIIETSTSVFQKAYFAHWYNKPTRMQKLLLIMMQKSMTSSAIILGKNWICSVEVYAKIVQSSMSYFMAFYSLRIDSS